MARFEPEKTTQKTSSKHNGEHRIELGKGGKGHQYRGHLINPLANKQKGNEKLPNPKDLQVKFLKDSYQEINQTNSLGVLTTMNLWQTELTEGGSMFKLNNDTICLHIQARQVKMLHN